MNKNKGKSTENVRNSGKDYLMHTTPPNWEFDEMAVKIFTGEEQPILATGKTADTWNSYGRATQHNNFVHNEDNKRKNRDNLVMEGSEGIAIKKGKKEYNFYPEMKPSMSTNKSRISDTDHATLASLYVVKIHDNHTLNIPVNLIDEYEASKEQQARNSFLLKRPFSYKFLKDALSQELDDLPQWVWSHEMDGDHGTTEKHGMQLIRLVLTDFYANCIKPT
ncbi:hypothetical protein DFQ28_011459 [Apophysomyces sp. BC1034]|nr:hypothetical protein DFQ30_011296 [Apophysomyces sp. BC1015]KAG0169087.1 hypothetical protein DFQ29_009891 [Apophysomyces sp. BC1021]KAG0184290.1 hypothetical protein DFQ28_011459 [Apophysomyces sp. BC1034]